MHVQKAERDVRTAKQFSCTSFVPSELTQQWTSEFWRKISFCSPKFLSNSLFDCFVLLRRQTCTIFTKLFNTFDDGVSKRLSALSKGKSIEYHTNTPWRTSEELAKEYTKAMQLMKFLRFFLLLTVFGKLTLYIITSVCVFSILFLCNF